MYKQQQKPIAHSNNYVGN